MHQDDATLKVCSRCGLEKSPGEFYQIGNGKLRPDCKACHNRRVMDWQRQHPDLRQRQERAAGPGFSHEDWRALCDLYGNACLACGAIGPLTRDHVVPLSQGGRHDINNIQPLCRACNRRKGGDIIDYRPLVFAFEVRDTRRRGLLPGEDGSLRPGEIWLKGAAAILGVCPKTVSATIRRGSLTPRYVGRRLAFVKADVEAYRASWGENGENKPKVGRPRKPAALAVAADDVSGGVR